MLSTCRGSQQVIALTQGANHLCPEQWLGDAAWGFCYWWNFNIDVPRLWDWQILVSFLSVVWTVQSTKILCSGSSSCSVGVGSTIWLHNRSLDASQSHGIKHTFSGSFIALNSVYASKTLAKISINTLAPLSPGIEQVGLAKERNTCREIGKGKLPYWLFKSACWFCAANILPSNTNLEMVDVEIVMVLMQTLDIVNILETN